MSAISPASALTACPARFFQRYPVDRRAALDAVLARIEDIHVTDAYHSLSIEGYRVSPTLIARVHSGDWNPERQPADRAHRDALAARGYWQAYQAVRDSVRRAVADERLGAVAEADHPTWYAGAAFASEAGSSTRAPSICTSPRPSRLHPFGA